MAKIARGKKGVKGQKKGQNKGQNKGRGATKVIKKQAPVKDARLAILKNKRKNMKDARDMLVNKAKTMDARDKLVKIRNFKNGKVVNLLEYLM